MDAVTGVFFFSAPVSPVRSRRQGVRAGASPGGAVLFRDYAVDDVKNTRGGGDGEVTVRIPARGRVPFGRARRAARRRLRAGDGTLAVFADEAAVERAFADAD